MREQLAKIIPTNIPDDPKGYRVLPAKPFQEHFVTTFGAKQGVFEERELYHNHHHTVKYCYFEIRAV